MPDLPPSALSFHTILPMVPPSTAHHRKQKQNLTHRSRTAASDSKSRPKGPLWTRPGCFWKSWRQKQAVHIEARMRAQAKRQRNAINRRNAPPLARRGPRTPRAPNEGSPDHPDADVDVDGAASGSKPVEVTMATASAVRQAERGLVPSLSFAVRDPSLIFYHLKKRGLLNFTENATVEGDTVRWRRAT